MMHTSLKPASAASISAIGGECRRHEGEAGLGAGGLDRILDGVEYRPIQMRLAALAGRHAADDVVP